MPESSRPIHQQKLESIGVITYGIAHEFTNLWMVVASNLDLARYEIGEDHSALELISAAEECGQRFTELIRALRLYSGRDSGEALLFDVSETLHEILPILEAAVPPAVQFRKDIEPELPLIRACISQVEQCIVNIFIGACNRFQGRSGSVDLKLQTKNAEASSSAAANSVLLDLSANVSVRSKRMEDHAAPEPYAYDVVQQIVQEHGGVLHIVTDVDKQWRVQVSWPVTAT